ncbi:MAG: 50S ribosomal protein L9 [Oscillospiraceae bacterium]|jgi:large subunit ribosomal protein L9|nr:50S ribosomal protein L9 [Oscillospiraceae bacterium]
MKVVLNEDVKSLGKKGEMVTVSDGYARNFLFPRKLAVEANAQALNELKNRETAARHKHETEIANANAAAAALEGKTVKLIARAGSQGRLFGSVTAKEVAEQLHKELGVEADRRKISIDDVKAYGTYAAEIKLYPGISATFYVLVAGE